MGLTPRLAESAQAFGLSTTLSTESCLCWDFGDGDEWPHRKDSDGRCTPISRALQDN
jgi:hypothetical protein